MAFKMNNTLNLLKMTSFDKPLRCLLNLKGIPI